MALDADCESEISSVLESIKQNYPDATVLTGKIGPVIGSHCGPDTIGIIFVKKN